MQQRPCHAAQHLLAKTRVAVAACDDEVRAGFNDMAQDADLDAAIDWINDLTRRSDNLESAD